MDYRQNARASNLRAESDLVIFMHQHKSTKSRHRA
jgi:hypothetical protein